MNVIIYARVSTDEQADKYGIESQLRACRELCKRNGHTILAELKDEGVSGATMERPALRDLRARAKARECEAIVMYDLDRLSRDLVQLLVLVEELEKNVKLEFHTGSFEQTPEGRMFMSMKGSLAQYERAKIRARTIGGRLERARDGKLAAGVPPFGFVSDNGTLVIDAERAPWVRQIFDWADASVSTRQIATRLRAAGVRTRRGGCWASAQVSEILNREVYAGIASYGATRRDGGRKVANPESEQIRFACPAIISREQWERVQAKLTRNAFVGRHVRNYLLRGLLYCGCGARMQRQQHSYACALWKQPKHEDSTCRRRVNAAAIERAVWDAVSGPFSDATALHALLAEHTRPMQAASNVLGLEQQVSKLKATIRNIGAALVDPDLADMQDEYRAMLKARKGELREAELELSRVERPAVLPGPAELAAIVAASIARYTDEEKREFLRKIVDRVTHDGERALIQCHVDVPAILQGPC